MTTTPNIPGTPQEGVGAGRRPRIPNRGRRPFPTGRDRGHTLPLALYVHIPFCETKCPYCDFNTYAGIGALIPAYLRALQREIAFWGDALGHPQVKTIFLGGGTPSLLTLPQLNGLLQAIHRAFPVMPNAETTLEANPGDLTLDKLAGYPALGVNRLSIGVQSLDDPLLQVLGRRHTAQQAVDAYRRARQAGHQNINLDLIYGISHQSLDTWKATVDQALALAPDHLSLYALTLEPNTPMDAWVREGRLPEPDPDLAADMYLHAEERLGQAGYDHYEISNWAKPGRESQHNLTYWRNLPYLGVGPGAHSSLWAQYLEQRSPHLHPEPPPSTTRRSVGAGHALLPSPSMEEGQACPERSRRSEGDPRGGGNAERREPVLSLPKEGGWAGQPTLGSGAPSHPEPPPSTTRRSVGAGPALPGYRFSVLRSPRDYIRRASQLPAVGAKHASPSPNVIPSAPPVILSEAKNLPSPSTGEGQGEGDPHLHISPTPSPGTASRSVGAGHALPWLHSLGLLDMIEPIPPDLEMAETMMMGLRLMEGVSDAEFTRRFGVSLRDRYGPIIADLVGLGLLHWQSDRLALTPQGHLLGNEVFQRFVAG